MRTKVLASLLGLNIFAAAGFAGSVDVTVQGTAGPWSTAVNSSDPFGTGETAPASVTGNGLDFSAGKSFTIKYVSGDVQLSPSYTPNDANGIVSFGALDNSNSVSGFSPGAYVSSAQYPVFYGELIGAFTNASGDIVGTPFAIGNSNTVTAPAGATQLQLGVNDNLYSDNSGSWQIQVSQPASASAIPLPPAAWATSAMLACLGIFHLGRRQMRI